MSTLFDRMSDHPEVRIKDLGDGIVACNFTHKAFREGVWDASTTAARGLFLDVETDKVLARGYEKFFGLDEWQGHDLNDYLGKVSYPVQVTEKGNGYLGIVSVVRGELTFYSKSGPTQFSEHFESMFRENSTDEQIEKFTDVLADMDASALFEVIDPARDPHIVQYDAPMLMLLNLVKNAEQFAILDSTSAFAVFEGNGYFTLPYTFTAETEDELREAVSSAKNSLTTEGVVIRDANTFMVKVKSRHYKTVKSLRGALTRVLNGKDDQRALPVLKALEADGKTLDDFMIENVQGNISLDLPKIAPYIL